MFEGPLNKPLVPELRWLDLCAIYETINASIMQGVNSGMNFPYRLSLIAQAI
jgi:hypothetical protein